MFTISLMVSASARRKLAAGFCFVAGVGGVLAYALTVGIGDAAPLEAALWWGSVGLILWGAAGWLALRWARRSDRGGRAATGRQPVVLKRVPGLPAGSYALHVDRSAETHPKTAY